MKKLKKILQSKSFYIIVSGFLIIYIIFFTKIVNYKSQYTDGSVQIEGKVVKYSLKNDKISFLLDAEEKINAIYYFSDVSLVETIEIGSNVLVKGELTTPTSNTIPNTFDYQKYLYNNQIYKLLKVEEITILNNNNNFFEKIKNFIYRQSETNEYIKLFIIGDKSSLDGEVYNSFKDCGVAHLLAVSGMHVSVFVTILEFLLKRMRKDYCKLIISVFLIFYSYIVNFSASILRVVIFFIINNICKKLELHLSNMQILWLTAFVLLIINPFYIYQVGFLYSFITVFSLFFTQKYLKNKYFVDILIISFWALLFTLPITVSLNYEINLLTFVSNFLLIPYVTFFLYPFSLICFIFPFITPVFSFFTNVMEYVIGLIDSVNIFTLNIPKLPLVTIIIYYLLLIMYVYFNLKRYLVLIFLLIMFAKSKPYLNLDYKTFFFDVGQGDSSLLISPHSRKAVMIDTGGKMSYSGTENYYVSNNIILYLKSIGITTIKYLIITHGDFDHMGDAINLVENFKVERVILNCGEFNELEQGLIKVLDKKKIPYYSCIKELNIDDNKLYFLNNGDYGNENDNSSVIYTELNNYKFLFMGDAGVEVEEDLLEKYNLEDIDVLKVGHHGSRTSSSKYFINEINPKYSIISVGKNNRYGHPNKEVLDNLNDSKIYRTDQDGSIMFRIKNNRLKIENCSP